MFQASNETCLSKAELLSDMHFKDLRTQKSLLGVDVMGPRVSALVCVMMTHCTHTHAHTQPPYK